MYVCVCLTIWWIIIIPTYLLHLKCLLVDTNFAKTTLIFCREHANTTLSLNKQQIQRVYHFKYLVNIIIDTLNPENELRWRIENASRIFHKMSSLFYDDNLNLKLWQKLMKCYTWAVRIIWLRRRMLGIPWKGFFINDEVLKWPLAKL